MALQSMYFALWSDHGHGLRRRLANATCRIGGIRNAPKKSLDDMGEHAARASSASHLQPLPETSKRERRPVGLLETALIWSAWLRPRVDASKEVRGILLKCNNRIIGVDFLNR